MIIIHKDPDIKENYKSRDSSVDEREEGKVWKSDPLFIFLAVQDSSIGDIVTDSLTHSVSYLLIYNDYNDYNVYNDYNHYNHYIHYNHYNHYNHYRDSDLN